MPGRWKNGTSLVSTSSPGKMTRSSTHVPTDQVPNLVMVGRVHSTGWFGRVDEMSAPICTSPIFESKAPATGARWRCQRIGRGSTRLAEGGGEVGDQWLYGR